ncbi:hypothetical protein PAXINDRAFT_102941 [Paxillus involutus ATCC 200175]|uniref:Uncharacterized protein n=1 Tax=Paxillus involutus ATCC 200175 TaxID=664439 RepID=A0A0C9SX15_PAXIN|nr:hypothetical protein PAXINDRAFT_102941 [Paxillus involutus ATCC 200175]
MSILFIVARYLGLVLAIVSGLCVVTFQFLVWGMFVYFVVTKVIMILRVAVMFNDPKRATYILSFLYLLVLIEAFIIVILSEGPHSGLIVSNVTLVDDTLCTSQSGRNIMFTVYGGIPSGLFDLLILVLSLYRFAVHSIETRKMLGRPKVNVYMRLLFEHSVLYFVLNAADKGLADGTVGTSSMVYLALESLYFSSVPFMLFPRLVLSFKGHRSNSSGLYVGSAPQQSHSHSHSASSGGIRSEEFELTDVDSPASRLPPGTHGSKKGGLELV